MKTYFLIVFIFLLVLSIANIALFSIVKSSLEMGRKNQSLIFELVEMDGGILKILEELQKTDKRILEKIKIIEIQ